jgi:hypothetical protein
MEKTTSVIEFVDMPCMEEPTDEDLMKLGLTREQIANLDQLADQLCESRYGLLLMAIEHLAAELESAPEDSR